MDTALPRLAEELQGPWQLPFEWLDLTPELDTVHPALVADDGTLYRGNGAAGAAEREVQAAGRVPGRRFAWAIAARVAGREHVLATSSFAEDPVKAWLAGQGGERVCWLLRVERRPGEPGLMVQRGPEPVSPRQVLEGPADLLCDLGMVLCRFDRRAFGRHFEAVFGHPVPGEAREWIGDHRLRFEAGEMGEQAFADGLLPLLRLAGPDRGTLERLWASIFEAKRSTQALLRRLAGRDEVELVVVSNTDPWALRGCRERFGLEDLLYGAVASYQDGVRPKGEDASMWQRARQVAAARRGAEAAHAVAIDDIRTYLHQALDAGAATAAVHYRHYAQFQYQLRRLGLEPGPA